MIKTNPKNKPNVKLIATVLLLAFALALSTLSVHVTPATTAAASDMQYMGTPTTTTQVLSGDSVSSVINQPMIRGTMTTRQEGNRLITDLEYIRHNEAVHVIHYSVRLFVGRLQDFEIIGTLNRQGFDLDLESKIRGMVFFPTPASIYRSYTVDWTIDPLWQPTFNEIFTVAVVGYNTWGGSNTSYTVSAHHFTYIVPIPLPPNPTPPRGYQFAGWYLDADFTEPFSGSTITADITLFARFSPIIYTITFTLNGGALVSPPTTFTVNDTIVLPIPTREGHHFRGWYSNSNFSGDAVTDFTDTIGNQSFYARWEIQRFTITFVVGGNVYYTIIVDWGTALSGMTFVNPLTGQLARLYGDSSLTDTISSSTVIDGNMVVYSDSPIDIFVALTFNIAGQTTTHLIPHGERLTLLPTVVQIGFSFVGWYTCSNFITTINANNRLTSNMTIYARLEPLPYTTLSFMDRFGNAIVIGGSIVGGILALAIVVGIVKKVRR